MSKVLRGLRVALVISVFSLATAAFVLASDPPDAEQNSQSGHLEAVDSTLIGGNYEIRHAIKIEQGQPPQTTTLTSNSLPDNGPRIAIAPNGDVSVVWWRDDTTDQVLLRTRTYSTGDWSDELLLGSSSESSSDPRIQNDGSQTWVAYQFAGTNIVNIAILGSTEGPDPWPTRSILATTSFTGDVDTTLHAESDHLWVTWVDSSTQVGWCQYNYSDNIWSSPDAESYSSDSVAAARSRIRTYVLAH